MFHFRKRRTSLVWVLLLVLVVPLYSSAQTSGEIAAKRAAAAAHAAMVAGTTSVPAGTVTYVYTDPQGTVLAEADAQGNIIARYDYAPYGSAVMSSDMSGAPNGPGYTGHVNDPETGLVYMQARYHDPGRGGFVSVDPVSPTPGNLYSFNRYAYASNNPIMNIDPDGRQSVGEMINSGAEGCGAVSCAGWATLHAVWTMAGAEPVSQIADKGWSASGTGDKANAVLAVAAVLPVGRVVTAVGKVAEVAEVASHIPGKGAVAGDAVQLTKQLASEGQVAELAHGGGIATHGAGTGNQLRQAERLAGQYGGKAEDYQKVSSSYYKAADGSHVETHAYRNPQMNQQIIEPKTIVNPGQQ
jgi:RHS repeat-associated protein